MKQDPIKELTIKQLCSTDKYIIPIYQRNYAWRQEEIEQLIQDICDSSRGKVNISGHVRDYHIGNLIVYARAENGMFEIIDGQQRHTTIAVLLAVLKNKFKSHDPTIQSINLDFACRELSKETLDCLYDGREAADMAPSILAAYEVCDRYITTEMIEVHAFFDYLLDHVKVLRVIVPEKTDLNHYFEIMNSRGEQLEKHEILKARLMSRLSGDDEKTAFGIIWDKCADMNRYVMYNFDPDARSEIFGKYLDNSEFDFSNLTRILKKHSGGEAKKSVSHIRSSIKPKFEDENSVDRNAEHFSSVINFPNFLLQVLRVLQADKIRKSGTDVPLNDKQLLETFEDITSAPADFIMGLLRCRVVFDWYIIRRENDQEWIIKYMVPPKKKDGSIYYKNSFDTEINDSIIMLQSMFHVSFPQMNYKHWLTGVLNYLYHHNDDTIHNGFVEFLEEFNDRMFFCRFNKTSPKEYIEIIFDNSDYTTEIDDSWLSEGTKIPNYIFNRLDYLIYKNVRAFSDDRRHPFASRIGSIDKFRFSSRSSVEHYYPRTPMGETRSDFPPSIKDGVDTFGNLCLISKSSNSRFSNMPPIAKRDVILKNTVLESLKLKLMMMADDWGPDHPDELMKHDRQMRELLVVKYPEEKPKSW